MLIVDMPMPKCCADCPMIAYSDRGMICLCTEALLETDFCKNRPSWCTIKGELVRCKDCKHNIGEKVWLDGDVTIDCDNGIGYPQPDWFCADGERKDGEHEERNVIR